MDSMPDPVALMHPDADEVSGEEDSETSEHPEIPEFDEMTFESDLQHARKELGKVVFYLNAVSSAAQDQNKDTVSDEKFDRFVDSVSDKIITALSFYRQYSRSLSIRCRTAQELHQQETSLPSAQMAKLERLQNELEKMKVAVEKLVPPDFSIFNDLKMLSIDEMLQMKPELQDHGRNIASSEYQHFILSEQMKMEMDRRRQVMIEIEGLTKKKRDLQDEVRKQKEVMNATNIDVDKLSSLLAPLGEKFGVPGADLQKDFKEVEQPILEALRTLLNATEEPSSAGSQVMKEVTPEANSNSAEVDEMETADVLSPETNATEPSDENEMETDQEVVREEGEASDEGEEDNIAS